MKERREFYRLVQWVSALLNSILYDGGLKVWESLSLHWCLDVTFREDHSRMRKDHSAENFAVVRHMVLNVLKNMPDKMSVARRRRHCSYDDDYLASVLLSFHA